MLMEARTQTLARGVALRAPTPVVIIAGSLLLGFLSLLLPSAPTYDPFSWIIWGREILHLDLNTVDGPSWKPLPVLLTTVTAPLGEASPFIWLAVARAGAIAAVVLAWMLAARLAGHVAGFVAAAGLLLMPWWIRNNALGNSEGLMVALVFAGVLLHLADRRTWAFTMAIGAGLLRPEAWPFLGLYALVLLWEDRTRLRWLACGLATLPVLWLGPELLGSGNAFRASDRAQKPNPDSPAFAEHPGLEVLRDGIGLAPTAAVLGAVLALVLGVLALRSAGGPLVLRLPRRHDAGTALVLALLAFAWIGLVALMTTRGFSGNVRYLIVPAALLLVLGGVGIVWTLRALAPQLATAPVALLVAGALALGALFAAPDADMLAPNLRGVKYQSDLYHDLGRLIDGAGGAAYLRSCGHAYTGAFQVPQLAWRLNLHTSEVDLRPRTPGVVFHVRNSETAPIGPPLRTARANVLGAAGHWRLTADCEPRR